MTEKFEENHKNRHQYAKELKEKNPDGMAAFCSRVPEEILYRANLLPDKILRVHGPPNPRDSYYNSDSSLKLAYGLRLDMNKKEKK